MSLPHQDCALILVGHGSTLNPDSSAPTHRHADAIRRMGVFGEVVCAFWKEEPSMREVYYMVRSKVIYIVPVFISEGYFCQQVLPRELRLEGPVTQRDGRTFLYCDPVGIHPGMTKLLLQRANEVAPGVPREQTSLVIVGHGTSLNENSRKAIEQQVTLIREGGHGFAEVVDAYMEEAPFVAKWAELTTAPNVVVVPFFIADGLHSYQDIPVLLGIESEPGAAASQSEVFRHNPHELHGRRLYYSNAIGTEPLLAEVILDQVRDFDAQHAETHEAIKLAGAMPAAEEFPREAFRLGQVLVKPLAEGGWQLRHLRDENATEPLAGYTAPESAREIAMHDETGAFRPLKSAPNLKAGWQLDLKNDAELRIAMDFLYPAAMAFLEHEIYEDRELKPVHLRETLGRQTGMYRFTNTISDEQAQQLVSEVCHESKCLRCITWDLDAKQRFTNVPRGKLNEFVSHGADRARLLCVEACTFVVSAARSLAQKNHREAEEAKLEK
jgi:sirohydrochlorin cobaltochelatase